MKVLHVITGLNQGGAEGALLRLITHSENPADHTVVSLMDNGIHAENLRSCGTKIYTLNERKGKFSIASFCLLRKIIKQSGADVVQTWMYHSDLIGGLAAKSIGVSVVWGIRHSDLSRKGMGYKTWIVANICAVLSYFIPNKIVNCSVRSIELHKLFGYSKNRFVYIPNGFDLNKYKFNRSVDQVLQKELGVGDTRLFGHAARFHPAKGHSVFLKAFSEVAAKNKEINALMIGSGVMPSNPAFSALVPFEIENHLFAKGSQSDIGKFYATIDCFVLSSLSEAFPNVVAEAMLAGVPCIVTDVGDAAEIVGETGWVIPPSNPEALANAMQSALNAMNDKSAWDDRKCKARERIEQNYCMGKMQKRFNQVWNNAMENN